MASQIVIFVIKNDISGQRKTVAVSDHLLANETSVTEDATERVLKYQVLQHNTNKPKLPFDQSLAATWYLLGLASLCFTLAARSIAIPN